MNYSGGCHCGAVRFKVEADIDSVLACNCSICSKHGYLLTFVPEKNFELVSGDASLCDYQFNKKVIHHYFCKTCGIAPFGRGKMPDGTAMRSINVRSLDDFDIEQFSIQAYDGKHA